MPSTNPRTILKEVFGYDAFKPLQEQVIENVLQRRDTLVVMPTGAGKSLCYQLPALIFPGLTVVVSPLIALMKDQVEQLGELGVAALFLNSSLSLQEYEENVARVRRGEIKLLYLAPEGLFTGRVFNLLASVQVDCLTIDEAHCISEWGHDFRPEYRQLVSVRQRFPKAVYLALTATATERVRQDIQETLGFQDGNVFVSSFNRENLMIEVLPKTDPAAQALDFVRRFPEQSGIIYCFSRKQVDGLAEYLNRQGLRALPYHAGLEDARRSANQEAFIRDDVQIIVATIAFGMGINKPNVRFILHYDLPKSMESYYQEIGRAGRDGLPAYCLLLYSYSDVARLRFFIDEKEGLERQVALQQLKALTDYAESGQCRRVPLLAYFGEQFQQPNCGMCDHCLDGAGEQPAAVDVTVFAHKFLSCVYRTGEKFGAGHIVDVLRGSKSKQVLKFDHQHLSTYGIGRELDRKQWVDLAWQLARQGLLEKYGEYGVLRLTGKAHETLKNKTPVLGVLQLPQVRMSQAGQRGARVEYDGELFNLLREKRKQLAEAGRVPPYVIFSDRTLVEMAQNYPMSPQAMRRISGVGEVKYERYGLIFLQVIRAYCEPRGLTEKAPSEAAPARRPDPSLANYTVRPRYIEAAEAYNAGKPVAQLAQEYQVRPETILDHLAKYAQEGGQLRDPHELLAYISLPPEKHPAVMQAFQTLGTERLKPVFEHLNGSVSYDDLKILRICFLSG
jgi:ATP-dependent DNA helicase RecQ